MKFFLLIVSMFLIVASTSNSQAELVLDGDFESSGGGWTVFGVALENETAPGINSAVEGLETLKAFGDGLSTVNFAGVYQDIDVDGVNVDVGYRVVLSGIVGHLSTDAISGGNGAYLEVAFVDALDQEFGAFTSDEVTASSATDVYFSLTTAEAFVPANAAAVRVKAAFRQDAANSTGAGWYDNLSLVATPEPGSFVIFTMAGFGVILSRRRRIAG